MAGASEAFALAKRTTIVTPLGGTLTTQTGQVGETAGFAALAQAAAQLSQFYLQQAERLMPVLWTESGSPARLVLQEGLALDGLPTATPSPHEVCHEATPAPDAPARHSPDGLHGRAHGPEADLHAIATPDPTLPPTPGAPTGARAHARHGPLAGLIPRQVQPTGDVTEGHWLDFSLEASSRRRAGAGDTHAPRAQDPVGAKRPALPDTCPDPAPPALRRRPCSRVVWFRRRARPHPAWDACHSHRRPWEDPSMPPLTREAYEDVSPFGALLPHGLLLDPEAGWSCSPPHAGASQPGAGCAWAITPRNIEVCDEAVCLDLARRHESLLRSLPVGRAPGHDDHPPGHRRSGGNTAVSAHPFPDGRRPAGGAAGRAAASGWHDPEPSPRRPTVVTLRLPVAQVDPTLPVLLEALLAPPTRSGTHLAARLTGHLARPWHTSPASGRASTRRYVRRGMG